MSCQQCCSRLGDVLDTGIGTCFPEAKPRIEAALSEIASILCESPCTVSVPPGTTPPAFIDEGWAGVLPDPNDCPLLMVVEGCNVWAAPNNQTCDGENPLGLKWCQICAPPAPPSGGGTTVETALIGNGNDTLIDVSNGNLVPGGSGQLVRRPLTAVFHNDIVGLGVAGNRFTLPAGTYDLQMNLTSRSNRTFTGTDSGIGWDSYLRNVTAGVLVVQFSLVSITSSGSQTLSQYARQRLVLASPTQFELATDRQGLGFFAGEFIDARAMRDEIYITRFS